MCSTTVTLSLPNNVPFKARRARRAFTLIELLVVVAVVAAVAGLSAMVYSHSQDVSKEQITRFELRQLQQALQRFKQDTGYLPGQGPFQRLSDGGAISDAVSADWLHSPANFWALFQNPLDGSGHPRSTWDPVTRRGWHGPYLSQAGNSYVNVSDFLGGTSQIISAVYGVADPFAALPTPDGSFVWSGLDSGESWGRPYLLFIDAPQNTAYMNLLAARVSGMNTASPTYIALQLIVNGSTTTDDSVLIGAGPDGIFATADDFVLTVLR